MSLCNFSSNQHETPNICLSKTGLCSLGIDWMKITSYKPEWKKVVGGIVRENCHISKKEKDFRGESYIASDFLITDYIY